MTLGKGTLCASRRDGMRPAGRTQANTRLGRRTMGSPAKDSGHPGHLAADGPILASVTAAALLPALARPGGLDDAAVAWVIGVR